MGTLAAIPPDQAAAHPHVWVDTVVTALGQGGQITGLREEWWFDEGFTIQALSEVRPAKGMASVGPRPLNPGEIAGLKEKAFSNLANFDYFTHVWAAGKSVGVAREVKDFSARMDGARLSYAFTVTLAQPVDPRAGVLKIGIWDDSYYVDVGPAKGDSARLGGDGLAGCKASIADDKDHPLYYGSVTPKIMQVSC